MKKKIDVTDLINRNIPAHRGKGLVCAGYPKIEGKRYFRNVDAVINWRAFALRLRKTFAAVMAKLTPQQIEDLLRHQRDNTTNKEAP